MFDDIEPVEGFGEVLRSRPACCTLNAAPKSPVGFSLKPLNSPGCTHANRKTAWVAPSARCSRNL